MILSFLILAAAPAAAPPGTHHGCAPADGRKIIVQGGSPVSAAGQGGAVAIGPKPDDPRSPNASGSKPDDPRTMLAIGPKQDDPARSLATGAKDGPSNRIGPKHDDPAPHPDPNGPVAQSCRAH